MQISPFDVDRAAQGLSLKSNSFWLKQCQGHLQVYATTDPSAWWACQLHQTLREHFHGLLLGAQASIRTPDLCVPVCCAFLGLTEAEKRALLLLFAHDIPLLLSVLCIKTYADVTVNVACTLKYGLQQIDAVLHQLPVLAVRSVQTLHAVKLRAVHK